MAKTRKYPTYKALAEAFKKGELPHYKLIFNGDAAYLGWFDDGQQPEDMTDEAWEVEGLRLEDECGDWFRGINPVSDRQELCDACDIPNEWS